MIIKYPDYITEENILIDLNKKIITIKEGGYIDKDGVSCQAIYSYLKEFWKEDENAIKYMFPLSAITNKIFIIKNNWKIKGKYLLTEGKILNKLSDYFIKEQLLRDQFEYNLKMELKMRSRIKKLEKLNKL